MKEIEDIFELLDGVLVPDAKKTVMFCEVEQTAYEVFYYSYFEDDSCKQCYELEAEGKIDGKVLETGFEKIAAFLRSCRSYDAKMRNVITIVVEGTSEKAAEEKYDKSVGLYKIKKEWKAKNLGI